MVQCCEGVGDALSEGGYVAGKCSGWGGLGEDVVEGDVLWPLCVVEEVVVNDLVDGDI